ncbi:hypothetical protein FS837_002573 [Tulasnella sp. UAMH 9824]|nr:hypothetical protein FS837_002573 [Tulasnella sp. UAMH 9824]
MATRPAKRRDQALGPTMEVGDDDGEADAIGEDDDFSEMGGEDESRDSSPQARQDGSMTGGPSGASSSSRAPSPYGSPADGSSGGNGAVEPQDSMDWSATGRASASTIQATGNGVKSGTAQAYSQAGPDTATIPQILIAPPPDFDPNMSIDGEGQTALHWVMGRVRVVKLLLTAWGDVRDVEAMLEQVVSSLTSGPADPEPNPLSVTRLFTLTFRYPGATSPLATEVQRTIGELTRLVQTRTMGTNSRLQARNYRLIHIAVVDDVHELAADPGPMPTTSPIIIESRSNGLATIACQLLAGIGDISRRSQAPHEQGDFSPIIRIIEINGTEMSEKLDRPSSDPATPIHNASDEIDGLDTPSVSVLATARGGIIDVFGRPRCGRFCLYRRRRLWSNRLNDDDVNKEWSSGFSAEERVDGASGLGEGGVKTGMGVSATATNSLTVPVYPSTTNTAAFGTPTSIAKAGPNADLPALTNTRPDKPRHIEWNDIIVTDAQKWQSMDLALFDIDGGLNKSGGPDVGGHFKRRVKAFAYHYRVTGQMTGSKGVLHLWRGSRKSLGLETLRPTRLKARLWIQCPCDIDAWLDKDGVLDVARHVKQRVKAFT